MSGLRKAGADADAVRFLVGHTLGMVGVCTDPEALPLLDAVAWPWCPRPRALSRDGQNAHAEVVPLRVGLLDSTRTGEADGSSDASIRHRRGCSVPILSMTDGRASRVRYACTLADRKLRDSKWLRKCVELSALFGAGFLAWYYGVVPVLVAGRWRFRAEA